MTNYETENKNKEPSFEQKTMIVTICIWPRQKQQAMAKIVVLLTPHMTLPVFLLKQCQFILARVTPETDFEPKLQAYKPFEEVRDKIASSNFNFSLDTTVNGGLLTVMSQLIQNYLSEPECMKVLLFFGIMDQMGLIIDQEFLALVDKLKKDNV